jgi:hypothetical protein
METSLILNTLVVVSGGILYLTTTEWRDRRRQDGDKKLGK